MNPRSILSVIPKPVQTAAWVLFGATVLGALVASYFVDVWKNPTWSLLLYSLAALVGGALLATWLLGLGYVYADARRRAMRPVLWVLVVFLFPHLLGFLLYFVLREPIATRCPHCGNTIPAGQRFCSWCGNPQVSASPQPLTSLQTPTP